MITYHCWNCGKPVEGPLVILCPACTPHPKQERTS